MGSLWKIIISKVSAVFEDHLNFGRAAEIEAHSSSLRIWFIIKMNHTGSTFQTAVLLNHHFTKTKIDVFHALETRTSPKFLINTVYLLKLML